MIVVADTSPLTALLHLQQTELLNKLYGHVYIPSVVAKEMNSLISFGYDVSFLQNKNSYTISTAADTLLIESLSEYLDAGEAEAIALAKELNADLLLIDEKPGRQFAEKNAITCKGIVGVLIEAKLKGYLPAIKPLLNTLLADLKFRLAPSIYRLALEKAGEAE